MTSINDIYDDSNFKFSEDLTQNIGYEHKFKYKLKKIQTRRISIQITQKERKYF